MNRKRIEAIELLDELIIGRVEPVIYAFDTNTFPNFLKVGDTYRPIGVRLNEWKKFFPDLSKQLEEKAVISDDVFFRDYSVHYYLEQDLKKKRLEPSDTAEGVYYSREFFENTEVQDVLDAIKDIKVHYDEGIDKYDYYSVTDKLPEAFHYKRGASWTLRPNQQEAVNQFIQAVKNGRKNLLMYAVMRFGKSFTSLCCALELGAKITLIVSAKADVKDEWKKTVESAGNFEGFTFLDSDDLLRSETIIKDTINTGHKVVIFLTLQDLQGEEIKDKHKEIFEQKIDLLIVDETHFGARAESFGAVLRDEVKNLEKLDDESIELGDANEQIKLLNAKIKLHLSGTPYRILMGSEFKKEDIIAFVQFSDIVAEQEAWDREYLSKDDVNEWDNPYYGFPQMVRFAFNPNKSSIEKMNQLKSSGVSFAFSALFEPLSIKKDLRNKGHLFFKHETEILDLLKVIDGNKEDANLLSFLDYDKIKEGNMCRHIVMVLPYCASCDAMEKLIKENLSAFKNLNQYEIVNISGVEGSSHYRKPADVKNSIRAFEKENKKTITLTVNRMLTGSTVEQWDTMLYFKDTSSPQEYDQAIFRLQNQYIRTFSSDDDIIKQNMKPQTLLVDFDPNRLFRMQEQKSLIYNVNIEKNGNAKLQERIREELRISPVIVMNKNKIRQVEASDILEAVSNYNKNRSVSDEVNDIPIDFSILEDEVVRKTIERQADFNSKGGLSIRPFEGDGEELDIEEATDIELDTKHLQPDYKSKLDDKDGRDIENWGKKIQTYYMRILFFAFLSKKPVSALDDIINSLDLTQNQRIAHNLNLEKAELVRFAQSMDPFKRSSLDYKIQNISMLASDESVQPIERVITSLKKFNRMSESEIITPSKVCDDMVALIPEEGMRKIICEGNVLLDIASKSGEYALALYRRLTEELKFSHEEVKNMIYAIPTSSIAYEFTRRFYEILDLNTDNIAVYFNAYDLLEVKEESGAIDYRRIKDLLTQNKKFSEIKLNDKVKKGADEVKFGAIVGNPPYQEIREATSDKPIYNYFMDISYMLSDFACLITPARFLFNAGKTSKEWNKKMLNDKHFKVVHYEQNSMKVFNDIDIMGGVSISIRDKSENFGALNTFTAFSELNSILKKVVQSAGFKSIDEKIYLQNKFNLEKLYLDFPEYEKIIGSSGREKRLTTSIFTQLSVFSEAQGCDDDIKILGLINNVRHYKWIPRKYLESHINLESYKIILPKSNGSGAIGEVSCTPLIGDPIIGEPLTGFTQSFISIGCYKIREEAKSLLKYIKTKFARTLLGTLKITQDNNKDTWANVPLQDFSEKSDIDWSKSIEEIDRQLYKKYKLEQNEIDFIESKIQVMK